MTGPDDPAHPAGCRAVELRRALGACRSSFAAAGFFSLFVNLLMLAPAFYMLEVYDRVLPSSSESTLVMLTLIVVFLFLVLGALEWVRSQILIAATARIDGALGGRVFEAVFARSLATGGRHASAQPLGDLMTLRQFLTGPALFAFFDAPWVPVYIAVMFAFHPAYGAVALVSALVLVALTVWGEAVTRGRLDRSTALSQEAAQHTQQQLRNAEVIEALGMLPHVQQRWQHKQDEALALQVDASRRGGVVTTLSKVFRLTVQSLILGLGAWLAIRKDITPGLVVAGAILLGRALAPLDLMISGWRGFQGARGAYRRLESLLAATPQREPGIALPAPRGALRLDAVTVQPPGAAAPLLKDVTLEIEPGAIVAIVGPSGAGKSTLLRTLLGLHLPSSGTVRLDGAELAQWRAEALGPHIGYLPQDVELLDGTVAENIARFGPLDSERILAAAKAADIHQLIVHLPEGYDTTVAGTGQVLSAGQRQRIGLARALYGEPSLVVLDEPNSNLDQEGEAALLETVKSLKARGTTVVVVTHRGSLLDVADRIAVLVRGEVVRQGPREAVLAALRQPAKPVPVLRAAPAGG